MIPAFLHQRLLQLVRWVIPLVLFFVALAVTVVWDKRNGTPVSGRSDEACSHLALARQVAEGQALATGAGGRVLLMRDGLWRLALAGATVISRNPVTASYLIGALCGMITLLAGMRLAARLLPVAASRWLLAGGLLLSPGWLMGLIEGTALPLASALVMLACLQQVEDVENEREVFSPWLLLLGGLALYVRIELGWLWVIFAVHHLILSLLDSERPASLTLILVRLLTTLLIFALLLLPMAAWHWTLVGVPFPLASEAVPLADRNLASQLPVLYALIAAYAAWLHTPFWSVWPLRICALIGAAGLVTQAVRRREMRASALPPLLCLLLPALCALGMPYTGASTARLLFRAVDPLAVLLAVAAVCQLPDWLNAVLRYRYLVLPQKWFMRVRVAAGLVLAASAVYGSRQWNRGWLAQVRERQAIHGTLQRLFQTGRPATPPPVVLTDQPGWILWETGVRALDLNGDLTPRFLHCRDRQGRLDAGRLQALLRESPAQYLLLWHLNFEGKGQNSLPLRRLHFPGDYVSILPPRLYAFRDSAGE